MKKVLFILFLAGCCAQTWAQYQTSEPRTWDRYPPEAQKRGFGLHASEQAQMDDEAGMEEVLLFSANNGHYPYFDLFRTYYVVVDYYSKEIKYTSDITLSTERRIVLEDRNGDGKAELYRRYFKDGKFSVDENGNNLSVTWQYDRIECVDKKVITTQKK